MHMQPFWAAQDISSGFGVLFRARAWYSRIYSTTGEQTVATQGQQEQKDREGGDAVAKRRARLCRSGERGDEPTNHRRPRRQSSSRA